MKHFKAYVVPFSDPDQIDDATEVYGGDLFPEVDTPCAISPSGQCEFSIRDPDHCMHCGRMP